jgi:lipopolysaccharide assembly protein B
MDPIATTIGLLVALLVGLAGGKAWERYKLRDGQWIDRRRARESPHYMLGLNFLATDQIDPAIEELSKAIETSGDSLEIRMILGNLYREKGQAGRAIQEHQALLQRPDLRKLEHANVLLCLGLDYKRGGFVDRALEAFTEVLRLDPGNAYALANLEKIHEDQQQWADAYATRQKLEAVSPPGDKARHHRILAYLEGALGRDALRSGDATEAGRRFRAAVDLDSKNLPARLDLGDLYAHQGDYGAAITAWEAMVAEAPDRAYLTFTRLADAYAAIGEPQRFPALCRRLIAATPQDWRSRLALATHLAHSGAADEGLRLLFEAVAINPHGLALHQAIWEALSTLGLPPALVAQYIELTRTSVFYLDAHVCVRCRYRSTELLWHCPHCHEWDTFVEERIAPAKDADAVG